MNMQDKSTNNVDITNGNTDAKVPNRPCRKFKFTQDFKTQLGSID